METPVLNDPQVNPTDKVLENVLAESYRVYTDLMNIITGNDFSLEPIWNFYKDGKSWACKVCYKKKTVFWLTVWDRYFTVAFYFTEKNRSGIDSMDIDAGIKENFKNHKPVGKLLPLAVEMRKTDQIDDVLKIIWYKKGLK